VRLKYDLLQVEQCLRHAGLFLEHVEAGPA
jgi:hypothetical protein